MIRYDVSKKGDITYNSDSAEHSMHSIYGMGKVYKVWSRKIGLLKLELAACEHGFEVRIEMKRKFLFFQTTPKMYYMLIPYQQTIQKNNQEAIERIKQEVNKND